MNNIGERVKAARNQLGWSQAKLAKAARVSAGTIGNLEAGTREEPRALLEIADALQVPAEWLKHGRNPPAWLSEQHPRAGVGERPGAQVLSHPARQHLLQSRAEVPVKIVGRPAATGEMVLNPIEAGGVVQAAFAGPRAYAVKVSGDALHPVVRHGSYIVLDPDADPVVGELVLLQMQDGTAALRELLSLRDDEVMTAAPLTGQRQTVERAAVETIVPVVMLVSASRWRSAAGLPA